MTLFYVDTSALVKRYVREAGSTWIGTRTDPQAGHSLVTSRVTEVETFSVLNRRRREANISVPDYELIATDFAAHCISEYEFIELTTAVIAVARQLLERHPLRAYDAVQLASALVANRSLISAGLPELVFLSADDRLLTIARDEDLAVDNPNQH